MSLFPRAIPGSPRFGIHHSPDDALPCVPLLLGHWLHGLDPGFLFICQGWNAELTQSCAPGEGTAPALQPMDNIPHPIPRYSGYSDKPCQERDTSHPKGRSSCARSSCARMLLLTVPFHLASLFPTHIHKPHPNTLQINLRGSKVGTVHRRGEPGAPPCTQPCMERDQHNPCVHRQGKSILTWPRVHP